MLVNVLFPPSVRSRYAGQAVQRLADEIAALLEEATEGLGAVPAPAADRLRATDSGNFFPTGTGWFSIPSVDRTSGDGGLTADATAGGWTTHAGSTGTSRGSTARSRTPRRADGSTCGH